MDAAAATPLLDFFRRGGVDRDIRLMAAQCVLGLRPHEQQGILELLVDDADAEVAEAARANLRAMTGAPAAPSAGVPPAAESAEPAPASDEPELSAIERIAAMSPAQRLALAMRGTREERSILIRDPNKIVTAAVLSSPKVSDSEIEGIAKMANVSEDVLRTIGNTRAWMKNYAIVAALARNAKTPVGVSLTLLSRLLEKDVKALTTDRNVPDVLRLAAKKRLTPSR